MANISNDEKNMIGLPVGDEEEEDEDEGEEEDIIIKANISSETEPEPVEIVDEPTHEQEPTIAGYLPAPWYEQAKEIETLKNKNQFLRTNVYELERKIKKMETEKTLKAELKKKRGEKREKKI